VDPLTWCIISRFRQALGFAVGDIGLIRKILVLKQVRTKNLMFTISVTEPSIATLALSYTGISSSDLREESQEIGTNMDLSVNVRSFSVKQEETEQVIMGGWSSWLLWELSKSEDYSGIEFVAKNVNLHGFGFTFSVHIKGQRLRHMVMTKETMHLLQEAMALADVDESTSVTYSATGTTVMTFRIPNISQKAQLKVLGVGLCSTAATQGVLMPMLRCSGR